ncbi:MAG: OsmC family protein [Chitinophagaceae bacterium]|nr:OsmC family protein [Anaerolineae bacterium]
MYKTSVTLENDFRTTMQARQHLWYSDMPLEDGGTDTAPNPEEGLLGFLGSCMAMTAQLYANRKGWPLERVEVTLDLQRFNGIDYAGYDGEAKFIHEIRESIVFYGSLDDEQRARLLEIAGKCPVRRILTSPTFFVELPLEPETTLTE